MTFADPAMSYPWLRNALRELQLDALLTIDLLTSATSPGPTAPSYCPCRSRGDRRERPPRRQ